MFFNSIEYLIFLPVVVILFYLFKAKYRWFVLFTASCIFYMYFIPKYILCLFFLILVDYFLAKSIENSTIQKKKKSLLLISIISNFGLLVYFKYLNFFITNINLFSAHFFDTELSLSKEILPIGLSFHTFQSVSYVVDVYRGTIKAEKHLGIYSSYVLFFPQMVAGPIERYTTLGTELNKSTKFELNFVFKAIPLILIGLFYKMVIADNCGEYVNGTLANLAQENHMNVILAVFFFCIQIYSDFFGYSLIAQGSARLFGIKLIDNFRFPFFSENIVEFWKKWHISLTSWFRDYVYIPLGGNRKSKLRYYLNIILIFTLSGLWHGAGYNFVLWGFLHSLFYLLYVIAWQKLNFKFPDFLSYILNFILVSLIFVFFRAGNFSESIAIFRNMLPNAENSVFKPISVFLLTNLAFIFFLEYFVSKTLNYSQFFEGKSYLKKLFILMYVSLAILLFSGVDNLPFIYFQF